ncbi:hypothetical protein PR048_007760 [Dryococelus australis]|uniref:Centaurin-gamma-1A n=1 Tax=Dryococelus australis TaxID=614101 RepID=A0ABQ9HV59_9NEOP|nr:hypothetical protein PR048_007760 [Dryococelus australis]
MLGVFIIVACQKIVQQRLSVSTSCLTPTNSRPSTPNSHFAPSTLGPRHHHQGAAPSPTNNGFIVGTSSSSPLTSGGSPASNTLSNASPSHAHSFVHKDSLSVPVVAPTRQVHTLSSSSSSCHRTQDTNRLDEKWLGSTTALDNNNLTKMDNLAQPLAPGGKDKDLPTPSSTPTTSRKSRRRSNLFTPSKKGDDKLKNGELGSGRAIPVKQGYLYKRSSKALNKDWKKKYVTLCDDGRLTYHPSLHDYMDDVHGKEISLQYVTVKVPGQKPRGSKSMNTATGTNNGISDGFSGLTITSGSWNGSVNNSGDPCINAPRALLVHGRSSIGLPPNQDSEGDVKCPSSFSQGDQWCNARTSSSAGHSEVQQVVGQRSGAARTSACYLVIFLDSAVQTEEHDTINYVLGFQNKEKRFTDKVLLTAFELLKEPGSRVIQPTSNEDAVIISNNSISQALLNGTDGKIETPNVKKRHRRMKSSGMRNTEFDDSDGYEFFIVSLDNKQWHFEAGSSEERDEWVMAIEQQILNSLQGNESSKSKSRLNSSVDTTAIQSIRTRVPGNGHCVDCDAANPDWASLNLGVVMCIECSGIHRNLGSHISRVRSLDLDEWPPGHLSVMTALGNTLANSVWEACIRNRKKPTPNSSREEKERWIRSKYESKEFLAPASQSMPLGQQLIDAVCRSDMKLVVTVLAHATAEHVNSCVSSRDLRTPLHLACAMGNLAVTQLLIWHNTNVKAVDHEGRTCLTYARAAASLALSKCGSGNGAGDAGVVAARQLIELLQANGCVEMTSGTLPRRRGSVGRRAGDPAVPHFDKLPSSVI